MKNQSYFLCSSALLSLLSSLLDIYSIFYVSTSFLHYFGAFMHFIAYEIDNINIKKNTPAIATFVYKMILLF